MKIIITEGQYDTILKQVKSATDPYKMLGITRPSKQAANPSVKKPKPQAPTGKNLVDGTTLYATDKFWKHIREYEGDAKNRVGGVKQPVLKAYKDAVGVWTIGYGHTGKDVKPNMVITKEQADQMLVKDTQENATYIRKMLKKWKDSKLPSYMLTQNQFDTLVSLSYNAGIGNVMRSQFIKELRKGNVEKAAELIKTFNTLNLPGLVRRRQDEYKMFKS
jgi:lysozyme